MIPIKYRLNDSSKREYIDKIIKMVGNDQSIKFSGNICDLIYRLDDKELKKELINKAKSYEANYLGKGFLGMWLVMEYNLINKVKKEVDKKFIKEIMGFISEILQRLGKNYEVIDSYTNLRLRRKVHYNSGGISTFLNNRIDYDDIYTNFKEFQDIYINKFSYKGINNWIIDETQIRVCPYCNLSFIYNRDKKVTAQLDHFFSKAEYPMFALCFYNLIPSCASCNRIKSDNQEELVSPYEEDAYESVKISCDYSGVGSGRKTTIEIETGKGREKTTIDILKLKDAYEQHKDYAEEMIRKIQIYKNAESKKLIQGIFQDEKNSFSDEEIERFYLGNYNKKEEMENRILAKMTRDIWNKYINY